MAMIQLDVKCSTCKAELSVIQEPDFSQNFRIGPCLKCIGIEVKGVLRRKITAIRTTLELDAGLTTTTT